MKSLFVGSYRDGTSQGRGAQQIMLGLDSAGVDIVARPVCCEWSNLYPLPKRIEELEKKSVGKIDNIIQCLPDKMLDINKEYGVPQYVFNVSDLKYSMLADKRYTEFQTIRAQSFYDVEVYNSPISENLKFLQDSFVFYVMGKMSHNKYWADIIECFQATFSKSDDVALVFKVTGNPNEVNEYFERVVATVHTKLANKYVNTGSFKQPVVICDVLAESDIVALHKVGDVFLNSVIGRLQFNTMDAMALDSTRYDANIICDTLDHYDLRHFMVERFEKGKVKKTYKAVLDDKYLKVGQEVLKKINE